MAMFFGSILKSGLTLGLINFIFNLILILFFPHLIIQTWVALFLVVVNIGGSSYLLYHLQHEKFVKIYLSCYVILITSSIVSSLLSSIYYFMIDPDSVYLVISAILDQTETALLSKGTNSIIIKQQLVLLKNKLVWQFSLEGILSGLVISFLINLIVALIPSLIVRVVRKIS